MKNILRAEFARLFGYPLFWICMGVPTLFTLFFMLVGSDSNLIGITFFTNIIMWFVPAVLIPNFIGIEHKDGTLRNKLICGHGRGTLFAGYAFVGAAAVLMIYASQLLIVLTGEAFKGFTDKITPYYPLILLGDVTGLAFMSLFCSTSSTVIRSKSVSIALSYGVSVAMAAHSAFAYINRSDPFAEGFTAVLTDIGRYLPFSQLLRLYLYDAVSTENIAEQLCPVIAVNCMVFAVIAAMGVLIFSKRDIK